jgi:hypothetical protein
MVYRAGIHRYEISAQEEITQYLKRNVRTVGPAEPLLHKSLQFSYGAK